VKPISMEELFYDDNNDNDDGDDDDHPGEARMTSELRSDHGDDMMMIILKLNFYFFKK
jgi:hypothetical protein